MIPFKWSILFCLLPFLLSAQNDYSDNAAINKRLTALASQHKTSARIQQIASSRGGKPIHQLTIGKGDLSFKPGLAIVAGVDGNHPAGIELALKLAEKFLNSPSDSMSKLLEETAIYIIPCVNPDAHEQYFASLKYERLANAASTDDDRDGIKDEDPFEDLNKDGYISMMRIQNPAGDQLMHKDDPRMMVKRDKKELDQVLYQLITEGTDNDKDGKFNEDGQGGIHLNKNFSFDYQPFKPGTGEHAVSEPENIGLLDSLFEKWNVFAVLSFALENNLSEPLKFDKQKTAKRIITGPLESDGKVNEHISGIYNKITKSKDAPSMPQGQGSFSAWAYFHYGRYSFVTPGWWAPKLEAAAPSDTTKTEEVPKKGPGGRGGAGGPAAPAENYDIRYSKWADSLGIKDYFLPWIKIEHPDFQGMSVEVGGFKPYMKHNPPISYLNDVADSHSKFVEELLKQRAQLAYQQVKVEKLDGDVFRISGKIVNTGLLPTHTELGDKTRWVRKIRNRIQIGGPQSLLIGTGKSFHNKLEPGESIEFQYLVSGRGKVILEAGSPMTGLISQSLDLK
jgi:hypothetical protein